MKLSEIRVVAANTPRHFRNVVADLANVRSDIEALQRTERRLKKELVDATRAAGKTTLDFADSRVCAVVYRQESSVIDYRKVIDSVVEAYKVNPVFLSNSLAENTRVNEKWGVRLNVADRE